MESKLLKAKVLAPMLGTTPSTLCQLARIGKLSRNKYGEFKWPEIKEEWARYNASRAIQRDPMTSTAGETPLETTRFLEEDPSIEIPKEHNPMETRKIDISNLSLGQKILEGLKRHIDGTQDTAYNWARALNEHVRARHAMLDLLEKEGKTLRYADVETWLLNTSRQNRDIWLSWPQRVSTEMAEELGIDARLMNDILLRHVRENLERTAQLAEHFGGAKGKN